MKRRQDEVAVRVASRSGEGENLPVAQQGKALQAPGKRRALGDIGNVQVVAAPRQQAGGKEDAKPRPATADAKQAALQSRRVTRSQSRALAQGGTTAPDSAAAAPVASSGRRTTATSAAVPPQPRRHSHQPPAQQQQQQQQQQQAPAQPQVRQQVQAQAQERPVRASPLPDIDAPDRHNHLAECRYVNDIYTFFRRVEPKFRAPADYMEKQADINERMRAILIDWLVEVHLKFKLMPESLFLAINLIDRYLAKRQVTRKNLQLVGVTAMLVAAKYEEIWAPEVRDFVYISDKAYTRKQILDTERDMLQALDYNLSLPTSYQFLARLLKAANVHYHKELALFVAYSAELCLVEYGMLRYSYSELAAGIMYVAMRAFGKADPFPHNLVRHAAATKQSVLHISKEVVRLVQGAKERTNLQAVVKKYSTPKFCHAADVPPPLDILNE